MSMSEGITRRYEDVPIESLNGAEWNTHQNPRKENETFKGLVSSIKKSGLIQRIVVRLLPDGNLEIIDGHRRVAAAKAARLETVPCDILIGVDDVTAQTMTATANIQRLDNDPLLEAALIERMRGAGKTFKEIAALIGKSERHVTRRARLTALTPGWRRAVELSSEDNCPTVAQLELIASYEPSIQDLVYEELVDEETGEIDWNDEPDWRFEKHVRKLDEEKVGFDIEPCGKCPYNTATHGLLFDFEDDDAEIGRCQNGECFVQKWNDATDRKIEDLRNAKVKVVEVANRWNIPESYQATRSREPGKTVPYVFTEQGIRRILWSVPRMEKPTEERVARTREEIAAEKAERTREREQKQLRNSAYGKVRKAFLSGAERIVDDFAGTERFAEFAADYIRRQFSVGYLHDSMVADIIRLVGVEALAKDYDVVLSPEEEVAIASDKAE